MEKKRSSLYTLIILFLSLVGAIIGLTLGVVLSQSIVIAAIYSVAGFCGIWLFARILHWRASQQMKATTHNLEYMEQLSNQDQEKQKQ